LLCTVVSAPARYTLPLHDALPISVAGGVNPIRADSADARYLGCPVSTCAAGVAAAASPITYVDAGDPPMLLVHGVEDRTVNEKRSEEHTSELQSLRHLVCRLLLEK